MENCAFCREIVEPNSEDNFFLKMICKNGYNSRILYETNNFVVMPSIGSFVEGYLLIVTKEHYHSMGLLYKEQFLELEEVITICKQIIQREYRSKSILFEHGAISMCVRYGGCIDHAHIHVVPIQQNIEDELMKYPIHLTKIDHINQLSEFGDKGEPYLFYQNTDQINLIIYADQIPSQFLRQIVSKKINLFNKWDWRTNYEIDNVIKTIKRLTPEKFRLI